MDKRVEMPIDPPDSSILFRNIAPLIKVIWVIEYFLGFFKPDPSIRVAAQQLALGSVKLESHRV